MTVLLERTASMTTANYLQSQACYRVEIVSSPDSFAARLAEWNQFLESTGTTALFFQWDWMQCWLEHFPQKQFLMIWIRNVAGQLVGAAPLVISRNKRGGTRRLIRHCRFLGSDPPVYDWMGFLVDPDEAEESVVKAIATAILDKKSKWDVLDLEFGPNRQHFEWVQSVLSQGGCTVSVEPSMVIPYISLPTTVQAFEEGLDKQIKRTEKRALKKIQEAFPDKKLSFQFLQDETTLNEHLDRFFDRHIAYWEAKGSRSNFDRYPNLRAFYKQVCQFTLAQCKTDDKPLPGLNICSLTLDDDILCYQMGFWQGTPGTFDEFPQVYLGHLINYNEAFKSFFPGYLLAKNLISQTVSFGAAQFQFGRGEEAYKNQWTEETIQLYTLRAFQSSVMKTFWRTDEWLKSKLKRVVSLPEKESSSEKTFS
jgi:CelD/BcsL family acetyltransferase involved in cellulose biosynthesis